ncbi:MAG: hydrolase [Erysipelotrichaceae bacterium]|nr:hydrolase [Erysipelotrichaceae bacterium]
MKVKCPCCEYYTLNDDLSRSYKICPVCMWERDSVQNANPDYTNGANEVSLNQARVNFKKYGAAEQRLSGYVRKPKPEELGPEK